MNDELLKKLDLMIIDVKYSRGHDELEQNYNRTVEHLNIMLKGNLIDKQKHESLFTDLVEQYGIALRRLESEKA